MVYRWDPRVDIAIQWSGEVAELTTQSHSSFHNTLNELIKK